MPYDISGGIVMVFKSVEKSDIKKMSVLLANRHKSERKIFHGLNERYENPKLIEKILDEKLSGDNLITMGAYDEDLVGFIISEIKSDKNFGRCAWVKYDGFALDEKADTEVYRHLYAEIAKEWLKFGCLKHYAFVPAGNQRCVDAWLRSGFSYEQVFGMAKLSEMNIASDDIQVRAAASDDKEHLETISGLILSYQAGSPTFAVALPELFKEIKKGYGGLVDDEEAHVLLAFKDDKFLGFTCGYFDQDEGMMRPKNSFELAVAGTHPECQSRGVNTLLTAELFNDAINAGYEYSMTDWRITNLKSSNFWPKLYTPYAYRMVRIIDERIYWADGETRI